MKKIIGGILIILITLIYFFSFQNNSLVVNQLEFKSEKVPSNFDQYKIVHLTDLHNKNFGENQSSILSKIEGVNPNIIVYTGDLIDANRAGDENSLLLMSGLVQIAPTYYVTGNHEWWSGKFHDLEKRLLEIGVHVLRNETIEVIENGDSFYLTGIDDPASHSSANEIESTESAIEESILGVEDESFSILMAHRPELIEIYSTYKFDLVFSGHAHGGQVRLPLIGGIVAPNQGFFPEYTAGIHEVGDTTMVVSRGLGNSIIPLRIFNRPEIIVLKLIKRE